MTPVLIGLILALVQSSQVCTWDAFATGKRIHPHGLLNCDPNNNCVTDESGPNTTEEDCQVYCEARAECKAVNYKFSENHFGTGIGWCVTRDCDPSIDTACEMIDDASYKVLVKTCHDVNTPALQTHVNTESAPAAGATIAGVAATNPFDALDANGDGVLKYEDIARATMILSAWSNTFSLGNDDSLDYSTIQNMIDTFNIEQNNFQQEILDLDVNGDGTVSDADVTHLIALKQAEITALQTKINDARTQMETTEDMTTAQITSFFDNARSEYADGLNSIFTYLGGTPSDPVTGDEFNQFFSDMTLEMAMMEQIHADLPNFELTRDEYTAYKTNHGIAREQRNAETIEYERDYDL